MASSPAITDIASAVHAAALAEAAARSQRDSATRAATEDAPTTADDRPTGAKAEAEELTAIYEDEKSRNDAIQANYHNRMEQLAERDDEDNPKDPERRAKEIELARLEFETDLLRKKLEHAPAQEPLPLRDLRTRAELCDVSSQLSTALVSLRNELAQEQAALERSLTLLSDLEIVEGGLKRRQDQLQARRDRDMTSDEAIAEMQQKLNVQTTRLRFLLTKLIDVTNHLFAKGSKKTEMRTFLDLLMNQAWDQPLDPYVSTANRSTIDPGIVELLIRANVVVQHPKDARRVRLVAFHRPTRARG